MIALACVALWAALALTLGTQVPMPGLDLLPSFSDGSRRAIADSRLEVVPDVDRQQVERRLASGVEVPRSTQGPVDDSSEVRAAVAPRGSTKDTDQTKAMIKRSGSRPGKTVATRPGAAKPVGTVPGNQKARKPAHAPARPTVKPKPHAKPRAKAVVPRAKSRSHSSPGPIGKARNTGVGKARKTETGKARNTEAGKARNTETGKARNTQAGKARNTQAATPTPRISPNLRPGNGRPGRDQLPAGRSS